MRIDLSLYGSTVQAGMQLCESIHRHGYEAYLVGGCVRDIVMENIGVIAKANIHDVDIATNMPIEQLRKFYTTADNNGEAHGTILVKSGDTYFEVTQFRTDGVYSDGRHPDSVNFTKSFKEDTARRDFTINAMGIDYDGNVIDYNGGIEDIKKLDRSDIKSTGTATLGFPVSIFTCLAYSVTSSSTFLMAPSRFLIILILAKKRTTKLINLAVGFGKNIVPATITGQKA